MKHRVEARLATPSQLCVFAFGCPHVYLGDQEISKSDWKYTKTREMFFFLLCHPPSTLEQIGIALWLEASPAQLRTSFRVALHHLRRALGRADWIYFENEHYAFNRALSYWFDVEASERQIAVGKSHTAARMNPLAATYHLRSAIELYQGDFLDGWNMTEWCCQWRRELAHRYVSALLLLGELYAAENQYAKATDTYRRAIAADAYLEVAHRELMRCYARMGEYGQAARYYQELSDLLRVELGVLPSPQTRALYARLLLGEPI